MAANAAPNVWTQMGYVPPRGPCQFKPSVLSAKCPCMRFMLHPLKSSSSFECDGCAHHASFHLMVNDYDDSIIKRWELEAKEKQQQQQEQDTAPRPHKRPRELGYENGNGASSASNSGLFAGVMSAFEGSSRTDTSKKSATGRKMAKAGPGRSSRVAATRAKGKVTEILDDDEGVEVLDVD